MSRSPDVSVVMSVYNGASHLVPTVDSILTQKGVPFEYIIVNDGSSDKTGEILDDYVRRDRRVRVIHQKNTGLTRALIRGCGAFPIEGSEVRIGTVAMSVTLEALPRRKHSDR